MDAGDIWLNRVETTANEVEERVNAHTCLEQLNHLIDGEPRLLARLCQFYDRPEENGLLGFRQYLTSCWSEDRFLITNGL